MNDPLGKTNSKLNFNNHIGGIWKKLRNKIVALRFNPNQDGEGAKKALPTCSSPVTFTNVIISPQDFLTFSFNPFQHNSRDVSRDSYNVWIFFR